MRLSLECHTHRLHAGTSTQYTGHHAVPHVQDIALKHTLHTCVTTSESRDSFIAELPEYMLHPRTLAPQRVAGCEVEEAFLAHVTHSACVTVNISLAHTLARHSVTIIGSSHCTVGVAITSCNATRVACTCIKPLKSVCVHNIYSY